MSHVLNKIIPVTQSDNEETYLLDFLSVLSLSDWGISAWLLHMQMNPLQYKLVCNKLSQWLSSKWKSILIKYLEWLNIWKVVNTTQACSTKARNNLIQ